MAKKPTIKELQAEISKLKKSNAAYKNNNANLKDVNIQDIIADLSKKYSIDKKGIEVVNLSNIHPGQQVTIIIK